MEFETPKKLTTGFVQPLIDLLTAHFKVGPYYTIKNQQMYAKLRRLGYFVPECENLYKKLLFEQLQQNGLYDFSTFDTENPVITEDVAPT